MLLLCYFIVRVDTILAVGSRHPEMAEFGTVFCFFFSISLGEAGFQEIRFRVRFRGAEGQPGSITILAQKSRVQLLRHSEPSEVQFPMQASHVSKAIYYFLPSLVAIVRGI